MNQNDLKQILKKCIDELYSKDAYLIEHDVHEQAISSAFSCYLKRYFHEWDVDTEYNRNGLSPKKLQGKKKRPDVIIHKRGLNNDYGTEINNLLIIEIKKEPTPEEENEDLEKIDAYIEEPPFSYRFGVFIKLQKNKDEIVCVWRERTRNP